MAASKMGKGKKRHIYGGGGRAGVWETTLYLKNLITFGSFYAAHTVYIHTVFLSLMFRELESQTRVKGKIFGGGMKVGMGEISPSF